MSLPSGHSLLTNLEYLSAGENNLAHLVEEIGNLESLKALHINDNPGLHGLPYELVLCSSLQVLNLEGCPLTQIPAEIVAAGPSLVIQVRTRSGLVGDG